MIDVITKKPLRVSTHEIAGSSLRIPEDQVDQIRQRLDRHAIRYWVDRHAISIDGGPEITYVHFGPNSDAAQIQAILDEAD
jgi:hypothetical protein